MAPFFSKLDIAYMLKEYTVFFSQISLRNPPFYRFSNIKNIFLGQSIQWVFNPKIMSFFTYLVFFVVFSCTNKQVSRFSALWVITFMEYPKTVGYFSKVYYPRESICSNIFSTRRTDFQLPIATGFRACPTPTSWGLFNFRPKSVLKSKLFHSDPLIASSTAVKEISI